VHAHLRQPRAVSSGVRLVSRRSISARAMRCSFSSMVRRVASVGCAVNTGSRVSFSQRLAHRVRRYAGLAQALQAVHHATRLRAGIGQLVLAPAADAVHLLGQVDQLEVAGEGAPAPCVYILRVNSSTHRRVWPALNLNHDTAEAK
jgi:hypothetical protein